MAAISPEFFKVFLPSRSSHQLLIPPSFVKKYCEFIPRKVDLKDPTGKLWNVDVKEVGTNLFMQNGWRDFATHYSLNFGDFIVFTWTTRSTFNVRLFGRNGCLKEKVSSSVEDITRQCAKEEDDSTAVLVDSRLSRASKRTSAVVFPNSGSIEGSPSKTRRLSGENAVKCEAVLSKEPLVRPKAPHFVLVMKQCHSYYTHIPSFPLRDNKIKLMEAVVLRDHNGKLWPLSVYFTNDGRSRLSSGWSDFRTHMKLEKGDKCLFEFVIGKGNICKELKVKVFYSNPAKLAGRRQIEL